MIVCFLSCISLALATTTASSKCFAGYRSKPWNANHLLCHGAIFFAIIAASIHIVHAPQNGSTSGVENFHHDASTNAAARFSFIGASHTC
jgi:hypothetical protein